MTNETQKHLLEALKEIAKGEGRFDRDPLTHAGNVIQSMIATAEDAIAKAKPKGDQHVDL